MINNYLKILTRRNVINMMHDQFLSHLRGRFSLIDETCNICTNRALIISKLLCRWRNIIYLKPLFMA